MIRCPHCGNEIPITPDEAARLLGEIGGKSTSKAKQEAARRNANMPAKKGKAPRGRPRKTTQ